MSDPAAAPPAPKKKHRFLKFLAVLLVLAVCAFYFRNFLVRKGMETAVTEVTGFPLTVGSFNLGLGRVRVEITDLRLSNPEGFEDPRCLHANRIVADIEGKSLFGKELHIEELDLNIPEIVVVKNAKGETNLDRLKTLAGEEKDAKEGKDGKDGKGKKKAEEKPFRWKCDRMYLKMGKVVFLDYTDAKGGKPKKDVWDLKVDEKFKDLDGPDQVVRIIVWKVITKTPVKLVTTTASALGNGLVGLGEGAVDLVKDAGSAIGGLFGGGEEPKKDDKKKDTKKK
jgi:hypothetical protein